MDAIKRRENQLNSQVFLIFPFSNEKFKHGKIPFACITYYTTRM